MPPPKSQISFAFFLFEFRDCLCNFESQNSDIGMLVRMKGGGNDENPHAKQSRRMTLREHRIVGPAAHHDGIELPE